MWGYWKRVIKRAWRRSLELVRWESWERITVFLVVLAITFGVTWSLLDDHNGAAIRALASLGATSVAVVLLFVWNVIKLPALMEAEAEEERKRIAGQLEIRNKRIQLRNDLGTFMLRGAELKRACSNEANPEPEREANQWLEGLVAYLEANLDVSYVARVNDASAVPMGMTQLSGNRAALDGGLRIRLYHLDQFLRELA